MLYVWRYLDGEGKQGTQIGHIRIVLSEITGEGRNRKAHFTISQPGRSERRAFLWKRNHLYLSNTVKLEAIELRRDSVKFFIHMPSDVSARRDDVKIDYPLPVESGDSQIPKAA